MVRRTDECHTGVTIVLNYDNDRAMVTYHGTMALTSMDMIPFDIFKDAKHFHMSSCYLLPKLSDKLPEIYQRARQAGMTTSLDPQWDPHEKWNLDLPALMEHLDVFFLTESELQNMTKNKDTRGTMQRICSGKNIIVVKQGKQGSTLYSKESGFLHSGAYLNPEIADAIGAGDSYNAGFIYKFIHGSELAECQDFGSLAGALCTTRPGGTAAFDDPAEIPSIMEQFRKNSEL
jgi:sugar/nucleoside kinase (ribokinase family)